MPVSGVFNASVTAFDVLGISGPPAYMTFTVDLDPPSSVFSLPLPLYTSNRTVTVSTTATDTLSASVAWMRVDGGSWSTSATWPGLFDGTHVFEVQGVDAAGNVQPPPYANQSCIVDTVSPIASLWAPVGGVHAVVPLYMPNASQPVCIAAVDSSPVTVGLLLDGAPAPMNQFTSCGVAITTAEGNHTLTGFAIDAAGNPSASVTTWFVTDFQAPGHVFQRLVTADCVTIDGLTACNSSVSAVFQVQCNDTSVGVIAPCFVEWAVQRYAGAASCVLPSTVNTWTSLGSEQGVVNMTTDVAAYVAENPVVRFEVFARAYDAAGNLGVVSSFEWWVDTSPPLPPIIVRLVSLCCEAQWMWVERLLSSVYSVHESPALSPPS